MLNDHSMRGGGGVVVVVIEVVDDVVLVLSLVSLVDLFFLEPDDSAGYSLQTYSIVAPVDKKCLK